MHEREDELADTNEAEEEKASILYVDDEPSNLIAFKAAFRRYYTIYTASSAKEGLEILRKQSVYLVITDQRMPEMTGVQFLEVIIPIYPDPLRMVLTGFSDVEAIIKAINNGRVLRYITKPWNADELRMIIDDAIRLFKLEKKNRLLMVQLQREVAKQQSLLNVFGKYVPEHIAREAVNYGEEETMVTEHRVLAVLFCDIRSSTQIAENMPADQFAQFINEYFTLMHGCINKHKGYIDKFLGDGILTLFGAPVSYIDNSENAVKCGLEMLVQLHELNEVYKEKFGFTVAIGIGIHTGSVIVGNFGAKERMQYTAIGDVVNIAFRIQELSRDHKNSLLISEITYNIVKDLVEVEDLGLKELKGKGQMMHIYRVLKLKEQS